MQLNTQLKKYIYLKQQTSRELNQIFTRSLRIHISSSAINIPVYNSNNAVGIHRMTLICRTKLGMDFKL